MACSRRLKLSDFGLNHEDAGLFTRSQWPVPQWVYVLWRLFLALYLLGWLVAHLSTVTNIGAFYVFLTDWTFTVFTLYAVLSCLTTVYFTAAARRGKRGGGPISSINSVMSSDTDQNSQLYAYHDDLFQGSSHDSRHLLTSGLPGRPHRQESPSDADSGAVTPLPSVLKLVWLTFNVCLSLNPIITLVFWSFLVPPHQSSLSWAFNINFHALNTVLVYADLLVSALPVRAAHFIYGMLYGYVYVGFSLIFYWAGGVNPLTGETAIYPRVLDWSEPGRSVLSVFGVTVASLVTHLAGYGVYRLRVAMRKRCCVHDKKLTLPV